jgi:hypothetical protein
MKDILESPLESFGPYIMPPGRSIDEMQITNKTSIGDLHYMSYLQGKAELPQNPVCPWRRYALTSTRILGLEVRISTPVAVTRSVFTIRNSGDRYFRLSEKRHETDPLSWNNASSSVLYIRTAFPAQFPSEKAVGMPSICE